MPAPIELLAIPAWNAPPRSIDDWINAFEKRGHSASHQIIDGEKWFVLSSLQLKAFPVREGPNVDAIHFELSPDEALETRQLLDQIGAELNWELHEESEDEDDAD